MRYFIPSDTLMILLTCLSNLSFCHIGSNLVWIFVSGSENDDTVPVRKHGWLEHMHLPIRLCFNLKFILDFEKVWEFAFICIWSMQLKEILTMGLEELHFPFSFFPCSHRCSQKLDFYFLLIVPVLSWCHTASCRYLYSRYFLTAIWDDSFC